MAIAFVQGGVNTATVSTSPSTVTFGSSTTAGNLVLVAIANDSRVTNIIQGVTDNKSNVYTRVFTSAAPNADLWWCILGTGGASHTVSVKWSTGTSSKVTVAVQEFSGFTGSFPLDTFRLGSGTSTSAASGSTDVTAVAASLVVSVVGCDDGAGAVTITAGSGYSNLSTLGATGANIGMASKVVAATGTQSAAMTMATTSDWWCGCAVFRSTSSASNALAVRTGAFMT